MNMMKSAAIAAILGYIVTMGMAVPSRMARHSSESEEFEVQAQWYLRAPQRGCVEVLYIVGGSYFRTYACDSKQGPCLYRSESPLVEVCPATALFHRPNLKRIVNIRTKEHEVRYYDIIGGACVFTLLPQCTCNFPLNTTMDADTRYTKVRARYCKCEDLPNGERVCADPIDCGAESQRVNCRCVNLPNGEKRCDPIDCKGVGMQTQAEDKDVMKALLEYINMKKN